VGIPLRHGRLFTPADVEPLVVINDAMAKKYWPADDAVGKRLDFGGSLFTIVGIVGNVEMRGPRGAILDELYVPYWQFPEAGINVVLKTAVDPAALIEPVKRAVKTLDPALAVSGAEPLAVTVANANGPARFYATLVASFAMLALVLAAVGVYGVMSYAVSQRSAEIGVRLALGANPGQIFRLVVGESLALAGAGLGIGTVGALAVGRWLRMLLYGIGTTDAATFTGTAVVLLFVAFLASCMPALRATRVDPMTALRAE
jgi:predicted lysophospholipase L1 biosynthesis ABC-type transport system permease subunit